jgi:exopolyphosphatase / guanosine-5'-triphosphate,3'-diphosphate pyrophosphatase
MSPAGSPMRVSVVDIGTNSTRLLIAEIDGEGAVTELDRRSIVTRLGQGLETAGALADEPIARVFAALEQYRSAIDEHDAGETNVAVLTSAVRDARNGEEFTTQVRERFGLDARTIPGEEEARLSFLGATSEREGDGDDAVVVIDIGGGSTEFIVGHGREVDFFKSTQVGVVRHTERHVTSDPPERSELEALAADAQATFERELPEEVRRAPRHAVAVAGTATSVAAIDLDLDPYDPDKVHGHRVTLRDLDAQLERLAAMTNAARRKVHGLHPDRAPTIVAGVVVLREALRAFGLDEFEASEHDILRGAALETARPGG